MKKVLLFTAFLIFLLTGCQKPAPSTIPSTTPSTSVEVPETVYTEMPTEATTKEEQIMETPCVYLHEPKDSDFVRVRDYIPEILEELKYATADNFTGAVIYNFRDVYLRYGTVKKLVAVQNELRSLGLGLKIWDGFRPISAQFKLWEILPDDTYVANPTKGFSNHSRGNAVDLTLVDATGKELPMPTGFDDFSGRADRNYSEIPPAQRANSELLQQIMERHGFQGYYGEWWHYNDTQRYEPERVFDPGLISLWQVAGETTAFLSSPNNPEEILAEIPAGSVVTLLGFDENKAFVSWQEQRGYVDAVCLVMYK